MTGSTTQTWPPGTRQLRVGDLLVDLRYRHVTGPEGTVELPLRMFELLLLFLAEPHVLHTRAALFERVWPTVIVEDANLSQSIWMLRKALGPDRKGWIRTVAKGGYLFEPPHPVEAIIEAPAGEAPAGDDTDPAVPAEPGTAITRRPRLSRWRAGRRLATAAVLLATLAGSVVDPQPATSRHLPPSAPMAVVLIAVEDRGVPKEQRWPTTLLKSWLGWKLNHLPEMTLLSEADLAADASGLSPRVVLLATGRSPNRAGEVYLRARFDDAAGGPIEIRGQASEIPEMADALTQQVLVRLLPQRAQDRWPPLALDAEDARRYVESLEAFTRRDWIGATVTARAVTRHAPDFGPAHLQLALALSRLAQAAPAMDQMATARTLLKPLPAEADAVLDAVQLAIDPQRTREAADAFAVLAARYPGRKGFALEQASLLVRSDKPEDARVILMRSGWAGQPVGMRIAHRLTLAEVELALGDPESARLHARQAEKLVRAAGKEWTLELGSALLLLAQAEHFQHRHKADTGLFEEAAKAFEQGGAGTDALLARVMAETARPPDGRHDRFDELLAKARAGGYRRVEVELLRRVAYQHYNAGQLPEYRRRLEQALDTATDAGDTASRQVLDLDLLNDDQLRGDLGSAERRLRRLRGAGLQGELAVWVEQVDAQVASLRGDFEGALATLDQIEQRTPGKAPLPPMTVARLACARSELLLARGELARARAEVARCAAPDQPFTRLQATLVRGAIELMAGDRTSGRTHIADAAAQLLDIPEGPDRWLTALQVAYLATRAGDSAQAEALYAATLPHVEAAGYAWLSGAIETGRAELAAARGDWPASERHLTAARRLLPQDIWLVTSRLDLVAAMTALAGDRPDLAYEQLAQLDRRAHDLGDVATQVELHSLMPADVALASCTDSARSATLARTGLRGANLDWLSDGLVREQRWITRRSDAH